MEKMSKKDEIKVFVTNIIYYDNGKELDVEVIKLSDFQKYKVEMEKYIKEENKQRELDSIELLRLRKDIDEKEKKIKRLKDEWTNRVNNLAKAKNEVITDLEQQLARKDKDIEFHKKRANSLSRFETERVVKLKQQYEKEIKILKRDLSDSTDQLILDDDVIQQKDKQIKELKHPKSKKERCIHCNNERSYSEKFDAYYCKKCDYWLEKICCDKNCEFCKDRPKYPSGDKQYKAKIQTLIKEIEKKEIISDHEGDEYARGFNSALEQAKQKVKEMMK